MIIISPMTGCSCSVAEHLISSFHMSLWKLERYPFMWYTSWANWPGGVEGFPWSWTCGSLLYWGGRHLHIGILLISSFYISGWKLENYSYDTHLEQIDLVGWGLFTLASVLETFCSMMPCHYHTGCIHIEGAQSIVLDGCWPYRKVLTVLVF